MYLVYREDRADEPAIEVFRDWILNEAQADERSWV